MTGTIVSDSTTGKFVRCRFHRFERYRDELPGDLQRLRRGTHIGCFRERRKLGLIRFGRFVVQFRCRRRTGRFARAGLGRAVFLLLLEPSLLGLLLDQSLPVGDRYLVVVGMDLAEGEKAVPVAAVFDEGGLQAGLYPNHLREVDVALELALGGGFDIEIL